MNKKKIRSIGPFLLYETTAHKKNMQIFPTQIWTILHLKNYLKENHWSDWSEIFCAWSLHPFVSIHKFSCSYHISFIQKQLRTTNLFFGTLFWILSYTDEQKLDNFFTINRAFYFWRFGVNPSSELIANVDNQLDITSQTVPNRGRYISGYTSDRQLIAWWTEGYLDRIFGCPAAL